MDRVFLFIATLGAVLILCQWYVFASCREYLFTDSGPMTRRLAYPVLGILGLGNFLALMFSFNSSLLVSDSLGHRVATVAFFSYIGSVLVLSLFFLILGAVSTAWRLKDRLLGLPGGESLHGSGFHPGSERGCVGADTTLSDSAPQLTAATQEKADRAGTPGAVSEACAGERISSSGPVTTRRTFLKWSTAVGLVTVAGGGAHGLVEGYDAPVVEEFDLFHPGLAGLSDPVTLIQLTDFHFGLFQGEADLKKLVERVNAVAGDAVVITGDLFHTALTPVEPAGPILRNLKSRRLGNFAVMGNHDFYAGEWRTVATMKESGIELLRDRWVKFKNGETHIHLGGIDDPLNNWVWGKGFPNFHTLAASASKFGGVKILLSHRPTVLPLASQAHFDLVLAGHTHGGQIIVPSAGSDRGTSLARISSPYTHGWYGRGSTRMYLNRGVGLTFVPWRINCRPEISVFHLHGTDPSGEFIIKSRSGKHPRPLVQTV